MDAYPAMGPHHPCCFPYLRTSRERPCCALSGWLPGFGNTSSAHRWKVAADGSGAGPPVVRREGLARMSVAETLRVAALAEYELLDRPADAELQALVRVAAAVADVPTATLNLIDSEYQCQLAAVGFEGRSTPRADSMCAMHFRSGRTVHVPDARRESDYAHNPWVD